MRTHYCNADRDWITFECECSWCGVNEADARRLEEVTSDAEFRRMMERLNRHANQSITDD